MIENFILVEVTAKSDDDVLSGDASRELSIEVDLDDRRNLPPCSFSRPKCCSIRSKEI